MVTKGKKPTGKIPVNLNRGNFSKLAVLTEKVSSSLLGSADKDGHVLLLPKNPVEAAVSIWSEISDSVADNASVLTSHAVKDNGIRITPKSKIDPTQTDKTINGRKGISADFASLTVAAARSKK